MAGEGLSQGQVFRLGKRIAGCAFPDERPGACRLSGQAGEFGRVRHDRLDTLPRAVPFQHGEFRCVAPAGLPVAECAGEIEDARLARRQQLLHRKFGRGVQVKRRARAVFGHIGGLKGVQMRLVARRALQLAAFGLGKALVFEPGPYLRLDPPTRREMAALAGMGLGRPPGKAVGGHIAPMGRARPGQSRIGRLAKWRGGGI